MNTVLIGLLALAAASIGSFFYGMQVGVDKTEAQSAREERLVRESVDKAVDAAAIAISKIEVKNVTVTQKLQREVIEKPVFRDCRSGPDAVGLFNSALAADATEGPASGDHSLPSKDTADRR